MDATKALDEESSSSMGKNSHEEVVEEPSLTGLESTVTISGSDGASAVIMDGKE